MAAAQSQLPGFRARQYAGPHPALAAQQQPEQQAGGGAPADAAAAAAGAEHIEPDSGRCVLHFDVDCFYAQVEEVRGRQAGAWPHQAWQQLQRMHGSRPRRAARAALSLNPCCHPCAPQVRDPSLRGRPVGVTQKYLVVSQWWVLRCG